MIKKILLLFLFVIFLQTSAFAGICDIKKPGTLTPQEANKNGVFRDNSYNEQLMARLEAAYDKKYHKQIDALHGVDTAPLGAHKREVTDVYYENMRN